MTDSHPLAKLRLLKKMSQKELADRAALAQRTIARLESGHTNYIRSDTLSSLAEAFKMTIDEFIQAMGMAFDEKHFGAYYPNGKEMPR